MHQLIHVLGQAAQVGADEADRIVDFVRHPGGQLADGGHFLRLQQLLPGALHFGQCLLQLGGAFLYPLLQVGIQGGQFVPGPGQGRLRWAISSYRCSMASSRMRVGASSTT